MTDLEDSIYIEPEPIIHEPFRPARPDVYGERIYLEHWQRYLFASRMEDAFAHVMAELVGDPTPRDAKVAASMFTWFGTNCGSAFISRCQTAAIPMRSAVFFDQWHRQNARKGHVNMGVRTLEYIVAADDERHGEITARDLEVADAVVQWLGSSDGQSLIRSAEEERALVQDVLKRRDDTAVRAYRHAMELIEAKRT